MGIKVENKNLPIDPNLSIGAMLKYCRTQNSIAIRDVVLELKVKEKDIIDLENDSLFNKRSNAYISGLVRSYAHILEIDNQLIREKLAALGVDTSIVEKGNVLDTEGDRRYTPNSKYVLYAAISLLVIYFFMIQDFGSVGFISTDTIIERITK